MDWNEVILRIGDIFLALAAILAWFAFWLWTVNWQKAWKVLGQGGWVPLILLIVVGAAAWSQVVPTRYNLLGLVSVPSFVWQLFAVLLFVGLALFCGSLQGYFGIKPIEVEVEPPPVAHGHGHDHGHGQH